MDIEYFNLMKAEKNIIGIITYRMYNITNPRPTPPTSRSEMIHIPFMAKIMNSKNKDTSKDCN
ncbi:protein of unknown function [Enterobacter cancerogenus]|nr:protein of unknown function [Enterobacter cancerogenus]